MPLTFIDIEKKKSWRIGMLFVVLLAMYVLVAAALAQGLAFIFYPFSIISGPVWVFSHPWLLIRILSVTFVIAVIHFCFSAIGAVSSVMEGLNAVPPDPDDSIHKRLLNIVDELHVATGDKRKITCMVIPTLSLNALAVTDFRGVSVIGITEGLLSRLSRDQLEAVMAHEAYHILSGDCLETTIAASLFGVYASLVDSMRNSEEPEKFRVYPAFILFWLLLKMSSILSMFISREREYRADAGAVRMTRDPLAMAGALRLIAKNWSGSGLISGGLEMLCIINPEESGLDESEGWFADLFSTHPPVRKRISVLLSMAHTGIVEFEKSQAEKRAQAGTGIYVEKESTEFSCPSCRLPLFECRYEGTKVFQCSSCSGMLVETGKLQRILARQEVQCTERVRALATAVIQDNLRNKIIQKKRGSEKKKMTALTCLKCGNPMFRTFYSLAYLIEIDRCGICGVTWFDIDELEMLQCVIENRITGQIAAPGGP